MSTSLKHSISGYAAVWFEIDAHWAAFGDAAFDEQMLKKFLAGPAPLLVGHDEGCPVGKITSAVSDAKGLFVTAEFLDTPAIRDLQATIFKSLELKMQLGLSVKFYECEAYTRHWDGVRQIMTADLIEVSILVGKKRPANKSCYVQGWRSYPAPTPKPRVTKSTYRPANRAAVEYADPAMEARKKYWPVGMQIKDCGGSIIRVK